MYIDSFPDFPSYSASWTPVYFEPILLSGERLTVLIVIEDENNEFRIFKTLRDEVLESFYGSKSKNVKSLIDLCETSIKEHLTVRRQMKDWQPPFDGLYSGLTKRAADDSITMIARQAIQRSSSLSSLSMAVDRDDIEQDKQSQKQSIRWQDSIIKNVLNTHSHFEKSFKVKLAIGNSKLKTQFGFLSDKAAVNFGVLSPLHHSSSLNIIKARILDLEHLMGSSSLILPENYSIILKSPNPNDASLSKIVVDRLNDTLQTIQDISSAAKIDVYTAETVESAAKALIKVAA
ncbi:hypothetical protein [Grimontia sp. NTOU-MAR1]|uniref:hypothetical protein n=1 Tax=Grimontia sp. NTOU-MAR1 TaxID=3111011 RepID=UPI002DB8BB86|nr:hypothetical protein [Grimontia sp. NTOU-MAR1]WRV96262.1 hypothetical protein VP504_08935 [Grimontia sp. NTOU-MAR1]